MSFTKFITMIDNDAAILAKRWVKGIMQSPHTKTYQTLDEEQLTKYGIATYEHLGRWLHEGMTPRIEVGKLYAEVGRKRYEEGFPLCEVLYAAHLTKRILADHVAAGGVLPDAVNLYNSLEFISKLYDFFDIATFYTTRGYLEAMYKKTHGLKGVDEQKLKEIFPQGSFYYEKETDTKVFEKMIEGFNLFKIK